MIVSTRLRVANHETRPRPESTVPSYCPTARFAPHCVFGWTWRAPPLPGPPSGVVVA